MFLPEDRDILMRPVLRGLCRYESILDGTLSLCDIMDLNEALDVFDENSYRASEARKNSG